MNKILTVLIILFLTGMNFSQVNPVANWKMNEGDGNKTYDAVGGIEAGINGPNWTAGHIEAALVSNGYADRIKVDDDDRFDLTTEGTIALWIKLDQWLPYAGLVHKGHKKNWNDEAYSFQFDSGGKKLLGGLFSNGGDITVDSPTELELNQWYYVLFTWNADVMRIYIDGQFDSENLNPHNNPRETNGKLMLGSQLDQKYNNAYKYFGFDGTIDEVTIYDKYLTSDQVLQVYQNYLPTIQPVEEVLAYWKMDEGSGSTTIDSENNLIGAVHGASWTNDAVSGSALEFSFQDQNITIGDNDLLNPTDAITIEAWIKWNEDPTTANSYANIISKDGDGQYQIQHNSNNTKFEFAINTENGRKWIQSFTSPEEDKWYYVAGRYSSSDEEMAIFVNGTKEQVKTLTGAIVATESPLLIGDHKYPSRTFYGIIDEVRLSNYQLTDEEIMARYQDMKPANQNYDNMALLFHLDEGAGTTIKDESGELAGNIIAGAEWIDGKGGSALHFNGDDQYIEFPGTENLPLDDEILLAAWVKAEENKTAKIFQKGDWDGHSLGMDIWRGWKATVSIGEEAYDIEWGHGRPVLGEWYHLVLTYDGSIMKFYVNAQLQNSKEVSGVLRQNSRPLAAASDNGGQKFFNGAIDDLVILNFAPTQEEIIGYYNNFFQQENVWQQMEVTGFTSFPYSFDMNSEGIIFSGNWGGAGIFKSTDEGQTWENLQNGYWVWKVAIDDDDDIYVGTSARGIIKSTDDGATWDSLSVGASSMDFRDIVIRDGAIYASSWGGGIVKSTNDGETWESVSATLPSNVIHSITFDSGGNLWAGAYDGLGVYKTSDDGGTWEPVTVPYGYIWSIDISPDDDIYLGTYGGPEDDGVGLYVSEDDGHSWTKEDEFDGLNIYGVEFVDEQTFVLTWENGMYITENSVPGQMDNIEKWMPYNSGLQSGEVTAIITRTDGSLLLGTGDSQLYNNFDPVTSVNDFPGNETIPDNMTLEQNYPNPFNPSTNIAFNISEQGFYRVKVYNIAGELIQELLSEELIPGQYSVTFNAEGISSGIYFYTLESSAKILTGKMLLLK